MNKMELKSIQELVALHRGLLEARFCEIANDPDVSGSPILSRLHREVISQIIECESSQKAQAWKRWLEISPSRREWSVAIERARSSSIWKNSTNNFKAEFAIDLLSPFETTSDLIDVFIGEVDRPEEPAMQKFVWVFSCASGRFPGGVFSELSLAEKWIATNVLSGVLTKYPLDLGSFDWAKSKELVSAEFVESVTPEKLASFSSASFEHHHYESGVQE